MIDYYTYAKIHHLQERDQLSAQQIARQLAHGCLLAGTGTLPVAASEKESFRRKITEEDTISNRRIHNSVKTQVTPSVKVMVVCPLSSQLIKQYSN